MSPGPAALAERPRGCTSILIDGKLHAGFRLGAIPGERRIFMPKPIDRVRFEEVRWNEVGKRFTTSRRRVRAFLKHILKDLEFHAIVKRPQPMSGSIDFPRGRCAFN